MAAALGFQDYGLFRDAFLGLCNSVRDDVRTIPLQKETVRVNWLTCLDMISKVFDAANFGTLTSQAFEGHLSSRNMEILDAISERFQAAGIRESTPAEMETALSAVRDVIEEMEKSGRLDARVAAVLKHYLQQMEAVFSHVEDFGDDMFWRVYKETFATFMQLHPVIAGFDNKEAIGGKLATVWRLLTEKSIAGAAVGANLVTIGGAAWPLLTTLSLK